MRRLAAGCSLIAVLWFSAPALHAGGGGPLVPLNCRLGDQPAATLLFPYFEVDLDNPGGPTTLIDIVNRSPGAPVLAHLTLWTDWGLPVGNFDVFLPPGDVVPINVRDLLLTGQGPVTGPGADVFPDCPESVGGSFLDPSLLQAAYTGRQALGNCFSSPRADTSFATGYITVDVAIRCGGNSNVPNGPGYFNGPDRVAGMDNVLWGNLYYVDPGGNFAQGQTAVHILALPGAFTNGDQTFYGKYVGFDASDERIPLSSEWQARFLTGGAFDGSELLIWRDHGDNAATSAPCGSSPPWFPLTQDDLDVWDELGNTLNFIGAPVSFPLATQRIDVQSDLQPPEGFENGWFDIDLDNSDGERRQAWVVWRTQAEGRFSVGQNGIRVNDLCAPEL